MSAAFVKAWRRVKESMAVRAAGVTFKNRQEILKFLSQFKLEDLNISLKREPDNTYDRNAIQVIAHIKSIRKQAHIGYIPKGLSNELAKVIDKGVNITANMLGVIGGYSYKESYGLLLNISI